MPEPSENNQENITEAITPLLEGAADDMSSIKEDISSINNSVSSLMSSSVSGNASSQAATCSVSGSYSYKLVEDSTGKKLTIEQNFWVYQAPEYSDKGYKVKRIQMLKPGNLTPSNNESTLCYLNDDGSVSKWVNDPFTSVWCLVLLDDNSEVYSHQTTVHDLVCEYQQVYYPELFFSSSSASSDVVLTRAETLQGMGDFSFLLIAIVSVLVLNLGVNLFRSFRSR